MIAVNAIQVEIDDYLMFTDVDRLRFIHLIVCIPMLPYGFGWPHIHFLDYGVRRGQPVLNQYINRAFIFYESNNDLCLQLELSDESPRREGPDIGLCILRSLHRKH